MIWTWNQHKNSIFSKSWGKSQNLNANGANWTNVFAFFRVIRLFAKFALKKNEPPPQIIERIRYFCIELAKLGKYKITGMDISKSFVEIAARNAAEAGARVSFRQGNASNMPFESGSFDFTFCQAAFKNFSEPVKAISEMYRILRPGGTAVIVDLRRDASPEDIEREIKGMGLGRVDEAFTRWTFKQMLLKSAYSAADMEAMISKTPFGKGRIDASGVGFQVWLEKSGASVDENFMDPKARPEHRYGILGRSGH